MPGRTRGETLALRDASREYAHHHGLPLDHATMVSMLEKGEAINEIVRQHGASPNLPTVHGSDLPTPNDVSDIEKSPHADIRKATLHASRVQWPPTSRYFRADASLAISRKRDRC